MNKDIAPDVLRQLLRYDADTGKLYWLFRDDSWFSGKTPARSACLAALWNERYANQEALSAVHHSGRKHGSLLGRKYQAHRVVWALVHGEWPTGHVDHISGDACDNRISNLRIVSHAENMSNQKLHYNNISGFHGVTWNKRMKRWQVSIRKRHIGTFANLEAAVSARLSAEQMDGGFHANHGRL